MPVITRIASGSVMSCPSVLIQVRDSQSEKQTHRMPARKVSANPQPQRDVDAAPARRAAAAGS